MNLILWLTTIVLLCTESAALRCHTCEGDDCTKAVDCDDRNVCMSSTSFSFVDGVSIVSRGRYCTHPNYCGVMDRVHAVSITVNSVLMVANVKCCNTDLCNNEDLEVPPLNMAETRGVFCKVCGPEGRLCRAEECHRDQLFCRLRTPNAQQEEGCVTPNFCLGSEPQRSELFPGFAGSLQFTGRCDVAFPVIDLPTNPTTTTTKKTTPPTSDDITTAEPTTGEPTTAEPTTAEPTTSKPTTAEPTPAEPTPAEPTPAEPTPAEPTTGEKCVPVETTVPPCARKG